MRAAAIVMIAAAAVACAAPHDQSTVGKSDSTASAVSSAGKPPAESSAQDELVVDASIETPRIVQERDTTRVLIPATFARSLEAVDPGFTALRRKDFAESVTDFVSEDSTRLQQSPLFAAIADFDGDGRADIALFGRRASGLDVVAILNRREGPQAIVVDSQPGNPPGERRWSEQFLTLRSSGTVDLPDYDAPIKPGEPPKRIPLVLRNPGFELVWLGKGATLYYYDGKRFRQVTSSD